MSDDLEIRRIALDKAIAAAPLGSADEIAAMAERFVAFLAGSKREAARKRRPKHQWTDAGHDALRRMYPTEPNVQAVYAAVRKAEGELSLSRSLINAAATRMGLRRPPECTTPQLRAMHATRAAKRAAS